MVEPGLECGPAPNCYHVLPCEGQLLTTRRRAIRNSILAIHSINIFLSLYYTAENIPNRLEHFPIQATCLQLSQLPFAIASLQQERSLL